MSNWINEAGKILEAKSGALYIKFEKGFEVQEGDTMMIKKFSDELEEKVEKGIMTQEKADEVAEKLHFVKYTLTKPPRK